MKNIFHAEMALLVHRDKQIDEELQALAKDHATWKQRVELAKKKKRQELVDGAKQRLAQVRQQAQELRSEKKRIKTMKDKVRYESRRPSGNEVQRAEALLESFRQSGLVDPERAELDQAFANLVPTDAPKTAAQEQAKPASPSPAATQTAGDSGQKSNDKPTQANLDDVDIEDLENMDLADLEALVGPRSD